MKLKNHIAKIKHVAKNIMNRTRLLSLFYVAWSKKEAVKPNVVLLESHHGIDFIGNPYYIACHLLASERYKHLKLVVVCPAFAEHRLRNKFGDRPIIFCRARTLRYCFHLATAGYLITDVSFPIYFSRRSEQKCLNTWHGTPLKTLGRRSAKDQFAYITNQQRNFLHSTDILAPNTHTEEVLLKDYMIEKIWAGRVLRCGYPRNDILAKQFFTQTQKVNKKLNVVFMPTWRGTLSTVDAASKLQLVELRTLFNYLDSALSTSITFWVRLHPLVQGEIDLREYTHLKPFPGNIEAYEHLAQCDVLITDYSSVMFDFAATRKPILLYTPDIDAYREERDFCLDLDSLPFEKLASPYELAARLSSFSEKLPDCDEHYQAFIKKFCSRDLGNSTESLCNHFFYDEGSLEVRKLIPDSSKKNILIYSGAFFINGITSSLKNLISLIDKEKYNVTICIDVRHWSHSSYYFNSLDERIDYIPARAFLSADLLDALRLLFRDLFYKSLKSNDEFLRALWSREYQRLFGNAKFDSFIHFCGYNKRAFMIMSGSPAQKIVFLHTDIAEELAKKHALDSRVFQLAYEIADLVATVRENAELAYCDEHFDFRSKVIYVPNTLSLHCKELSHRPLYEAFRDGIESDEYLKVYNSIETSTKFKFINLARFSPEKGQLRLIEAFEKVWLSNPSIELYIVGSYGTLYNDVLQRAESSPAYESIYIIVGSDNPFPLMAHMDTLIFSSFYEGIGLVLYEAFSLGLKVISTDIPGPSELLANGYGLIIPNNTDGLVSGMLAALKGEIPDRPYDFEAHNKFALEQFYKAIGDKPLLHLR